MKHKEKKIFGHKEIEKIDRYLRTLPPSIFDVPRIDLVEILEMTPGAYNLNYRVRVNARNLFSVSTLTSKADPLIRLNTNTKP